MLTKSGLEQCLGKLTAGDLLVCLGRSSVPEALPEGVDCRCVSLEEESLPQEAEQVAQCLQERADETVVNWG